MTPFRALAAVLATAVLGHGQERRGLTPEHQRDLAALQPAIDAAIDDGVAWLLGAQQRDGSWSYEEEVFATGQTAFAAYTLLKCDVPPEHAAVRRAIARFTTIHPSMVYAAGAQVLALTATHDRSHHPRIRAILDEIESWQELSWSYPNPGGRIRRLHASRDLSITQFALLAYRAAAAEGLPVPARSLRDAFEGTLRFQHSGPDGGFSYRWDDDRRPTGSMTTAGIASLTMALQTLGKKASATMRRQHEDSCERALAWLDRNWAVDRNPNYDQNWLYYYLYGVERVGGLLGTEYVGDHPWYLEGATFLVEKQAEDGHWAERSAEADTCFALLFLARATAPVTGDARRGRQVVFDSPSSSDVEFAVRLANDGSTMQFWLSSVAGTREGDRPDAWPDVRTVEYLVDDEMVATIEDHGPWRARPCFAEYRSERNGLRQLRARVAVADPNDGSTRILESAPLVVELRHALEPWMMPAATARDRNLILGALPVAVASSVHKEFHAENAVDGRESSGWMYDSPDRDERTLTIRLSKAIRANTLRLSQTHGLRKHAGIHDRIVRVAVQFDRREPFEVELAGDETTPTVVRLDESVRVRRVVVRVLEVEPGGSYPGLGGFAEVGLELNG